MGLLAADLQVLANTVRHRAARRLLFGTLSGLLMMATLVWLVASELVAHDDLLARLHQATGGGSRLGLLGYGLMACPVAATWLGLSLAQRQLFETPELPLWRAAPQPGWRAPLQVLLRASFATLCWATALAAPFVVAVLRRADAPALAYLLLPLAILVASVPLLATLLAGQIVVVRFFAGRLLRLATTGVAALASLGFSIWLILGLLAPGRDRDTALVAVAGAPRQPWTIGTASRLLDAAAEGRLDGLALAQLLGWLAAALAIYLAAALLHPRACERQREAETGHRRARARSWPTALTATIRRKEFAVVLQQPGAALGFLVFGALVFVLMREQVLVARLLADRRLPRDLALYGALLEQWFVAVLLVLYAHMGRLVLWDGPQWSLYVAAPPRPAALLRGKLTAIGTFLMWPLLLVATFGVQLYGAGLATTAAFVATAGAGTLIALGVLAALGTWPYLIRPDEAGQSAQGGRSLVGAMLLVLTFELAVAPAMVGWLWLATQGRQHVLSTDGLRAWAPPVVAAAWGYALLVAGLGFAVGVRNLGRLLRPRAAD